MSTRYTRAGVHVLELCGVLDASTYKEIRDSVIKAAVDAAAPVVIDVNALEVADDHAWSVFTSARWHVKQWPEVPLALVCADPDVHRRLVRLSVARYVPIYGDVASAAASIGIGACRYRRRARERFGPHVFSVNTALAFVHEHLQAWSLRDRFAVASTVTAVFAENALNYASDGFDVRIEAAGKDLVIAVSDASQTLAVRRERLPGGSLRGLDIVSALCPRWGNTPTSAGKTVWAYIGPEDTFAGIGGLFQ